MKPLIIALITGASCLSAVDASAQGMSMHGIAAAAFAATDCCVGAAQNRLVESTDCDGGGEMQLPADHDLAAPAVNPRQTTSARDADAQSLGGDPAMPAAATPRRPTYRWQSLVPGAIK